jgi:hypothetical protein
MNAVGDTISIHQAELLVSLSHAEQRNELVAMVGETTDASLRRFWGARLAAAIEKGDGQTATRLARMAARRLSKAALALTTEIGELRELTTCYPQLELPLRDAVDHEQFRALVRQAEALFFAIRVRLGHKVRGGR